ncbi:MAG TPA: inositol monophosphatase [Candidatus Saccharimonadales bacterium]|nr:inositol monophosphatase [Candidatus Saccharimonadales bacterium]
MNDELLTKALEVAKQAAQEVGGMLLPHYGNIKAKVESDKAGNSIAGVFTELDERAEKLLQKRLGQFGTGVGLEIGFTGEQYGEKQASDISWLVDPIDGTTHFIRGLPMCTVMIALVEKSKALLAVIHDIANQQTYWAARGRGAFCGGEKLMTNLKKSLVCFESKLENPQNLEKYMQIRQHTVTIIGLYSGYEFIMIASGKLDGKVCLEPYGKDWDFAPGSLLVQEAGGVASNIGRADYDYRNHNFIIAGEVLHRELTDGSEAIFPVR